MLRLFTGDGSKGVLGDWSPPRASAHFLVDGKDVTESGRNPAKSFDNRRQYAATVGKSGKHRASKAVPNSPKTLESALVPKALSSEVL